MVAHDMFEEQRDADKHFFKLFGKRNDTYYYEESSVIQKMFSNNSLSIGNLWGSTVGLERANALSVFAIHMAEYNPKYQNLKKQKLAEGFDNAKANDFVLLQIKEDFDKKLNEYIYEYQNTYIHKLQGNISNFNPGRSFTNPLFNNDWEK